MKLLKITVWMLLCAVLLCTAVSCNGKDQESDPKMTTHADTTDAVTDADTGTGTGGSTGDETAKPPVSYLEDGPLWSKDY